MQVLDASPVHVKALYRRGMAYMSAGDFEEARSDFNKMMTIDKTSEPNARAALLMLKQKEQHEVERKARNQFKGLFDKKPGEIAKVGVKDRGEQVPTDNLEINNLDDSDSTKEEDIHEPAGPPPRPSLVSKLWSTSRKLFTKIGVQRCTIL